jgi:hypothetical protein
MARLLPTKQMCLIARASMEPLQTLVFFIPDLS